MAWRDRCEWRATLAVLVGDFASERNVSHSMVAYKLFRLDMIDRPVWMSLSRNFRDRWIEEREFRRQRASDRSGGR